MEIDITDFVTDADAFEFSASRIERGDNAGPETWANAKAEAAAWPMLDTEDKLDAMRDWARASGGWDAKERAAFDATDLNALFIQLVSGDMREMGLDDAFLDEFDWSEYEARCNAGEFFGQIFKTDDGRIYYSLGG